jgi:putative ABC transport system substrate-binding protein
MKRRALLFASGAWLAAAAAHSLAQTPKSPRRIAVLLPGRQAGLQSRLDAFRAELKTLGHIEGRDILIDARWAEDKTETLASLAAELVALGPAVIITASSAGVAACKKATSTIPIVFATAGNPVEQGFVASLRRPGGNITGIILHTDLNAKMVEVAREALPQAQRLAILVHDSDPAHKSSLDSIVPAAKRFKFELLIVRVGGAGDFDRAFREIAERKTDVLLLATLVLFASHQSQLAERALKARLPLLGSHSRIAEDGGLLGYGTLFEENYRRAAALVDKILRGAKPGDLPVEQPERYQLVVNLKTAKAIGITLAPVTMLRATKVIE